MGGHVISINASTTGKSRQDPVVIKGANLACITLHDGVAHGDLSSTHTGRKIKIAPMMAERAPSNTSHLASCTTTRTIAS